jgi:hypothetical protein
VVTGALGLCTYFERLAQGLRQLITGNRKFTLDHIERDDIASLTKEVAEISGITYVMEVEKILESYFFLIKFNLTFQTPHFDMGRFYF